MDITPRQNTTPPKHVVNQKPQWKTRRRVVISTLSFCAVTVGYMVYQGGASPVHQTAVTSLTLLAASVIGSYVFGAVWSDIAVAKKSGGGFR